MNHPDEEASTEPAQEALHASRHPAWLLQQLIRFDTTNPPGREQACVMYIDRLLSGAGIATRILARSPERPNLIARLRGTDEGEPLMLYGHVDVVPTAGQTWQHDPFGAEEIDGYIWGRGALDMKGGVAMMLSAFLRMKLEGITPRRDILLVIVSDEENGGDYGAKWLVETHPELFAGVRHAIGEFGGFSLTIAQRRFYPIQIAEKQLCWIKVTFSGPGGHGSMPVRDGAMARLGRFLRRLDTRRPPMLVTPAARLMFEAMASGIGGAGGHILRQILTPVLSDGILKLLGQKARMFEPLLHHTVSPTILHGGTKINVIPSEASVELDGRLLPGYAPEDLIQWLRPLAGEGASFEVMRYDPYPTAPDMALFDTLSEIIRQADPEGMPIPLLLSGVTDGRFFARLGIQTYGFLPMKLPDDFNFISTIHAADERVPASAIVFGADAIFSLLKK